MAAGYEKELADLKQKQADLERDLLQYSKQEQAIKDFIENAKEYVEMPKQRSIRTRRFPHNKAKEKKKPEGKMPSGDLPPVILR